LKQDAQLAQRDRAAGCVIVFAKSRRLELGDNILRTVWYKSLDRSFFRFVTIHACDGQTDRQTEFSSQYHVCITCSAV